MKNTLPLKTLDGNNFDPLFEYKGNPLCVVFYHTSCLGGTGRALPLAYNLSREFPGIRFVVVHVNSPSMLLSHQEILSVFVNSTPPSPIYLDPEATNFKKYHAEGTPYWLIFDNHGNIVNSIFGSQENAQNRLYYILEELSNKAT